MWTSAGLPLPQDRRNPVSRRLLCNGGTLRLCDEAVCPRQRRNYLSSIPAYEHLGYLCDQCSGVMDNCRKAHAELPAGKAGDPDELRRIAEAYRERQPLRKEEEKEEERRRKEEEREEKRRRKEAYRERRRLRKEEKEEERRRKEEDVVVLALALQWTSG
jgi:hypothetical protein